jgi:hypothetical protein
LGASEPKAMNSTMPAAMIPMSSLLEVGVRPTWPIAWPPSSTLSPGARALSAVSMTFRSFAELSEVACSVNVTVGTP